MNAIDVVKKEISNRGCTQAWVIREMNASNPSLNMTKDKFSSTIRGKRKMTADELMTFCRVTTTDPDIFMLPTDRPA